MPLWTVDESRHASDPSRTPTDMKIQRQGLLGGIVGGDVWDRVTSLGDLPNTVWKQASKGGLAFLTSDEPNAQVVDFGEVAVAVRGYVVPRSGGDVMAKQQAAELVHAHYRDHGQLPASLGEGNFSLVLVDAQKSRVLSYRNLANNQFTYYAQSQGLLLASNLKTLAHCTGRQQAVNRDRLPAFFLFRWVPGTDTLFEGLHRLLPGETLRYEHDRLQREQTTHLANLSSETSPPATHAMAVEQLNGLLGQVTRDIARVNPHAVTLLSGGVDSSAIHAHWIAAMQPAVDQPASFSITTDDPLTQGDTQYALSAAKHFGTRHETVNMTLPYEDYLQRAIAALGEPPNHVQGVFYGTLAREFANQGIQAGLCGEGADCLLGTPWTDLLQRAQSIRTTLPFRWLQTTGALISRLVDKPYWANSFQLAPCLDDFSALNHPVNLASAWTDTPSVIGCFGREAVDAAHAYRRSLLSRYCADSHPVGATHELTLIGEVIDSASLWTATFHHVGVDLYCPFLDSRILRFVGSLPRAIRYPNRQPKRILKDALIRFMPSEMVYRPKLAFGQPIFQWMAPGGPLSPLVERIDPDRFDFLAADVLQRVKQRPNWFLFSLLCYDTWYRQFNESAMPVTA